MSAENDDKTRVLSKIASGRNIIKSTYKSFHTAVVFAQQWAVSPSYELKANWRKMNREAAHCVVFHKLGTDDRHFPLRQLLWELCGFHSDIRMAKWCPLSKNTVFKQKVEETTRRLSSEGLQQLAACRRHVCCGAAGRSSWLTKTVETLFTQDDKVQYKQYIRQTVNIPWI